MDMEGYREIPAAQQTVWDALNDPQILQACIPGCESMEKLSDTEQQLVLMAAVGPVKARFKGRLKLSEVEPPVSYCLSFEGQGGVAGFAKGSARVRLEPAGAGTALHYTASAQVGGKLAQVGSRLIDGTAKKLADEFFTAFNDHFSGGESPAGADSAAAGDAASGARKKSAQVWIGTGLVAIVVLVAILYFTL